MTALILAIAIAMGVSFLCSVMEAAILSLNPGKLAVLEQRHPKIGKICSRFKKDIEKPIAVILILNTTAHTFGAAIAGAQFDKLYGSEYIWIFSLAFTILMVQYTEILPKTLGVRFNIPVMRWTAVILRYAVTIMNPLIQVVHFINRPFEGGKSKSADTSGADALEELDALAVIARKEAHITKMQERAIRNIPDLKEDKVTEIMVPPDRIVWISCDMEKEEVLERMKKHLHSRYPVRKSGNDPTVIGMLEIRQMLFCDGEKWQDRIRPISSIDRNCTQLHIAENITALDSKLLLVRDERKNIIGMLTTNNLLMKLFDQPILQQKGNIL